jgi:hypothetical protein
MNEITAPRVEESLMRRICGEYLEMPGLHLTPAQARRLFNLPDEDCEAILDYMVLRGLLARRPNGTYCLGLRARKRARDAGVSGLARSSGCLR